MNMKEVRSLAKKNGVKLRAGITKVDAIRSIQRAEGNFDCFARAMDGFCDQLDCLYRADCLKISKSMA